MMLDQWRRQWRIKEMQLLFLAVMIAVVAITSVQFFTSRVEQLMLGQVTQMLGGDLVVTSTRPLNRDYLAQAQAQNIQTAEIIYFPSMLMANEQSQLTQIQAVSTSYPLLGHVKISTALDEPPHFANGIPKAGEAWAEARVFASLNIQPGAEVQLGGQRVRLTHIIRQTPDQSLNAFQFAPRLMMPLSELKATGLLTPASRARFNYLFAGDSYNITNFRQWLTVHLKPVEQLRGIEDSVQSIQQTLTRGQRFLAMAALLTVILAGAAIALTSYSYAQRETRQVAILKTLGAGKRWLWQLYSIQLALMTTVAGVLGSILGYGLQLVLGLVIQSWLQITLPAADWQPLLIGLLTAWLMGIGFSLPYLLSLIKTLPISILQQQVHYPMLSYPILSLIMLVGLWFVIELQLQDILMSSLFLVGILGLLGIIWLIATGVLLLLQKLSNMTGFYTLHLAHISRRSKLLLIVFSVGFFSLLLLSVLRTDLLGRWQASIPADAPDHFLVNIQPDKVTDLTNWLQQHHKHHKHQQIAQFYPMIRGRLVQINQQAISPDDYETPRAKRLLSRAFNLSATTALPADNNIVSGQWFEPNQTQGFSVDISVIELFGLELGDELTFDIAGTQLTEKITSIRSIHWDNMRPNFFVLTAPELLNQYPKTYMTSIQFGENPALINRLVQRFPATTVIDVREILAKIQDLMSKASLAVQTIFIFSLFAGIVVLLAAIQSQRVERQQEIAILKTIGANRAQLRQLILVEFIVLGAVSGVFASILAMVVGNIIAYQWFELAPTINFNLLGIGLLAGGSLVGLVGYWNLRPLLQIPPMALQAHR